MFKPLVFATVLGALCLGGTASAQTKKGKDKDPPDAATKKKIDALYKKAIPLLKDQEFDDAKELFDEIVDLDPNQADAWAYIAYVHNQKKEYKDAVKAAKKAVKIDEDHVLGWSELSFALFMQKKYADAIPALEKTIELNPKLWPAYDALAKCYQEEGMDDEADAILKKKKKLMAQEKKPTPKDKDEDEAKPTPPKKKGPPKDKD
jgi:tetratricopeptide (TPR) repeat protein